MSTFRIGKTRRSALPLVIVLTACGALTVAGCKNANDVTGTTASPTIYVAGAWTGTFVPAEPAFYAEPVPAQANLQQTGTSVDGTITISGSPVITIHATISGDRVDGTIEDAGGAGTAFGQFGATHLSFTLHPHLASGAGTLGLHR